MLLLLLSMITETITQPQPLCTHLIANNKLIDVPEELLLCVFVEVEGEKLSHELVLLRHHVKLRLQELDVLLSIVVELLKLLLEPVGKGVGSY